MSSQALYRKWRSRTFEDIVAQEHVTQTLRNALRLGKIAHAYLFAGPRGTGKTSTARLLAKAVNCLGPKTETRPCNRCAICLAVDEGRLLDLIEIDAASNRGIDEIRALREKVNFRPTDARFKVYVVDEVHMLTNEAFNALLKTLEEPPAHVIFVLATTEPHKIPATVLSRCQRFDFRRIPLAAIVKRLQYIAAQEGIEVEPEVLEFVARQSTGSLRDAISLLDQLVAYGSRTVSVQQVQQVLGLVPHQVVHRLAQCLIGGDIAGGLIAIGEAVDGGADVAQIGRELVEYLRGLLLTKMAETANLVNAPEETRDAMKRQVERVELPRLVAWIKTFNEAVLDMRTGTYPQLLLEMAWVTALTQFQIGAPGFSVQEGAQAQHPPEQRSGQLPVLGEGAVVQPVPTIVGPRAQMEHPPAAGPVSGSTAGNEPLPGAAPAGTSTRVSGPTAVTLEDIRANWAAILAELQREHHNSSHRMIHALLQMCQPVALTEGELLLGFQHETLAGKLADPARAAIAQQAIEQAIGVRLRIRCKVIAGDHASTRAEPATPRSSGAESGFGERDRISEPASDPTQLAMATDEVTTDESGSGSAKSNAQAKFGGVIAGDRLVKEVIEKYGVEIEAIEFVGDEVEQD